MCYFLRRPISRALDLECRAASWFVVFLLNPAPQFAVKVLFDSGFPHVL
jgi:hypothetical protein